MDLSRSLSHVANAAFQMFQNGECGFSEEEERIVQRNLLYWMERRHHFDEKLGRACIANIYYFKDDVTKEYAPFFGYEEMKEGVRQAGLDDSRLHDVGFRRDHEQDVCRKH